LNLSIRTNWSSLTVGFVISPALLVSIRLSALVKKTPRVSEKAEDTRLMYRLGWDCRRPARPLCLLRTTSQGRDVLDMVSRSWRTCRHGIPVIIALMTRTWRRQDNCEQCSKFDTAVTRPPIEALLRLLAISGILSQAITDSTFDGNDTGCHETVIRVGV
jgi:hypothetical protein